MIGLGLDVEENDIRREGNGPLDVGVEETVGDLRLEEINRALCLTLRQELAIAHEVGKHFEKMGFSRPKISRNPSSHLVRDLGLVEMIRDLQIAFEKMVEVLVEFAGDDKFVEFLPNRGVVLLIGFDDAIDRAGDVTGKKFTKSHHGQGTSLKER